ncbi:hypothetical protein [Lysinibacillus fusiformis]|uniref:hypothetical protein n=1 Tax=Lysinibacillus fusiformis TaxID=28031 RepID=UPI001596F56C|nr:hypothetical protein [Lysinibacillus fusiformis]
MLLLRCLLSVCQLSSHVGNKKSCLIVGAIKQQELRNIQINYITKIDVCGSYLALVKQLTAPSPYGYALPL